MRTYVLYFAAIVLFANGGYALVHLGYGNESLVNYPLLLGSSSAALLALFVVRRRLRQRETARKE